MISRLRKAVFGLFSVGVSVIFDKNEISDVKAL